MASVVISLIADRPWASETKLSDRDAVEFGKKPLAHRLGNGNDAPLPAAHRVRRDVVALDLALNRQRVEVIGLLLLRPTLLVAQVEENVVRSRLSCSERQDRKSTRLNSSH